MTAISMKVLLEAGVHFGHQAKRWHPRMAEYIFGTRNNLHIIDLQKTVKELRKTYKFVRDLSFEGKDILFVGTKKQAREVIIEEAKRCGMCWITQRWLGGTLTNFEMIKKSVDRLKDLEKKKTEGLFGYLPKKEAAQLDKEVSKLENSLSGIKEMNELPGAIFVIDCSQEATAIAEANKLNIPVIGVVDTNCDPQKIDYVIPGNDDAIRSIKLFASIIADAIIEAQRLKEKQKEVSEEVSEEKYEQTTS